MDFHQLLAKMQQLDQPAAESAPVLDDAPMDECPADMPASPMTPNMSKPDTPPPSMSLNLNAQGLDNIEELMKLIKAVNPELDKPAGAMPGAMAPTISIEPMDKPEGGLPSLGNLDAGPLKMLPDLDADNDDMPGGEKDDMPGDEKDEKEAFGNSLGDSEPEEKGNPFTADGDDLNKPKKTFPKVAGGDNPMQKMESGDLRAQIRAELLQRLAEAKGAK